MNNTNFKKILKYLLCILLGLILIDYVLTLYAVYHLDLEEVNIVSVLFIRAFGLTWGIILIILIKIYFEIFVYYLDYFFITLKLVNDKNVHYIQIMIFLVFIISIFTTSKAIIENILLIT